MTKEEAINSAPEYFRRYIKYVKGDDLVSVMKKEHERALAFYQSIPESKQEYRYDAGKWHVKEILTHVIDTERVMSTRALAFSREDDHVFPGFNQDQYVLHSGVENRELSCLIREFDHLRAANIELFDSFDGNMLERHGRWENNTASVAALGYIIIGHEMHHRRGISDRILEVL